MFEFGTDGMRSRWRTHHLDWNDCYRCPLHKFRQQVVLGRGTLPADILFVGEAPGRSEDLIGEPFVGPSGKLLTHAIQLMIEQVGWSPTFAITNVVACIPLADFAVEDGGPQLRTPAPKEVAECSPRLYDFIELANPQLIVLLGKTAKHVESILDLHIPVLNLYHPAYWLRRGGKNSSVFTGDVLRLSQAVFTHVMNLPQ